MDELESQLTNPEFIKGELGNLVESMEDTQHSLVQKHIHGESLSLEEKAANNILSRIKEIHDDIEKDPKRQILSNARSVDTLSNVIPFLVAENNKRLLTLFRELHL